MDGAESIATASRVMVSDYPAGPGRTFSPNLIARLSSAGAPWEDSIIVEEDYHAPSESGRCFCKPFTFVIHLRSEESAFTTERLIEGRFKKLNLAPGEVQFTPAGAEIGERWKEWRDALVVAPAEALVMRTALELYGKDRIAFRCQNGVRDAKVLHLALALKSDLETGCQSGRIYGESLAFALAAHLLSRYSDSLPPSHESSGGMPSWLLKRVLSYIEENLGRDLRLPELAESAHMNPYYFCRQFKQSVGMPPHRYVLWRRVEKAKRMLEEGRLSLADISNELGFAHQSHFSTIFRRITGTTPKRYATG